MAACFWLWLIWLLVAVNGLTGWVAAPAGTQWGWPQYRIVAHVILMLILGYLLFKLCGSLAGNLVH